MKKLLNRLEHQKQAFILRRSAGFAYSFLSLLRAEPANCKVTLLPLAMSQLLRISQHDLVVSVENAGLSIDAERRCVHAINVLRLILLDGGLGSDLDGYIAPCCDLAIKGFQSQKWQIRNSCVMLFSAVVQKAIESEKNDTGKGLRKTSTAFEFFSRFPSLFPSLLRELKLAVSQYRHNSVIEDQDELSYEQSLYPILLFIAKFRPPVNSIQSEKTLDGAVMNLDLSPFISTIEECRRQKTFHIRQMASKALSSLIPLQQAPAKVTQLLANIVDVNEIVTTANEAHCTLQFIWTILTTLLRNINVLYFAESSWSGEVRSDLSTHVLPAVTHVVSLYVDMMEDISSNTASRHPHLMDLLLPPSNAIVLLRILDCMRKLLLDSSDITNLCGQFSYHVCTKLLFDKNYSLSASVENIPFLPLLWQEGLVVLSYLVISNGSSTIKSLPTLEDVLMLFIDCPVSEVRLGILNGCQDAISSTSQNMQKNFCVLCNSSLIEKLLSCLKLATKPSVKDLMMSLLCRCG